jgi:FkbM family methyltransferase
MQIDAVLTGLTIAVGFLFFFVLIYLMSTLHKLKLNLKRFSDVHLKNTQATALKLQTIESDNKASLEALQIIDLENKKFRGSLHGANVITAATGTDPELSRRLDRVQNDLDFIKNHASSYVGQGVGLTNLIDETPIYINSNDFGGPANFINGGRYEEEYFAVLASFKKPNSVFLDIGANLGVFSLRLAPMMRSGTIHAFEPNPKIRQLLERSVHLNGIGSQVQIHGFGLSDKNQTLTFNVPDGHAGGGSVVSDGALGATMQIDVKTMDSALPNLRFDIAKIDVEGHELHALRGMHNTLAGSPDAVLIFEKLGVDSGIEADLLALFTGHGLNLYRIDGIRLVPVTLDQFKQSQAYFIAASSKTINNQLDRNFVQIYPQDMFGVNGKIEQGELIHQTDLPVGTVLFHGPYWYLPRGSYRLDVVGKLDGKFNLAVAEKFGYSVEAALISNTSTSFNFVAHRDLTQFEVVGRSVGEAINMRLSHITLTRLG